ncbi:hypothetical protein JTB14_035602 [Gonioctena quinquepunctata]|nr:hypothetical protein JTB14_035602 [Gonioctena quinquepunctata]
MLGGAEVNYPAREKGVTRHMRGDEAQQKCPEIILARVPQVRGKADLTKYREAGKRVAAVLQTFTSLLERASVDEAYLDITELVRKREESGIGQLLTLDKVPNTFVVGCDPGNFLDNLLTNKEFSEANCRLAIGGVIVEEIRAEVLKQTGYKCSAGIAHNKILAKLVCGLHKPDKQTILPQDSVPELYKDLPIRKIKSLGGKFGNVLSEELQITNMAELVQFSESELIRRFDEKNGKFLYNIARGIDSDPVTTRLVPKSIGCCKRFPGKTSLLTQETVTHWLNELATEISERLEKDLEENNRRAKQMVVSFAQMANKNVTSSSRTHSLNSYDQSRIAHDSSEVIKKFCQRNDGSYHITFLGISVGNFQETKNTVSITTYFKNVNTSENPVKEKAVSSNVTKKEKTVTSFFQEIFSKSLNKEVSDGVLNAPMEGNENQSEIETGFDKDVAVNNSIYSDSTDDLDEDPKNYIYYEDMYPESISRKPVFTNSQTLNNTIDANDEPIVDDMDLVECNHEIEDERKKNMGSFFRRYFESTPSPQESPNKNYSRSSEDLEIDGSKEENEELIESATSEKGILESPLENEHSDKQVCPQCNKKIVVTEMESHMDYHFALEIVRGEKHLYTSVNSKNSEENKDMKIIKKNKEEVVKKSNSCENAKNKGAKRKAPDAKPISSFFEKGELNDDNSEYCSDCDKRIPLYDFTSHADYHVAKKLHAEINASSTQTSIVNKGNSAMRDRVVILVDIDCFYCQVEEKLNPDLQNKAMAVVQFNTWREGGIIAANYLAREKGVTKGLWCYEAKEKCPEILFATVAEVRGRADLTKYREAGKEVANVLQTFTSFIERASVDEAYLDVTTEVNKKLCDSEDDISIEKLPGTHVVGCNTKDFLDNINNGGEFSEDNRRLAMGAIIAEEIRAEVFQKTGYQCSAGIAHNKILAKLACGIKKPNAQTILPQESVIDFYRDLPLEKIKSLGGKFGKSILEELQITTMGQLLRFTERELIKKFEEKTGKWLYNIARGIDLEPVKTRIIPKSISCCKRFPGKNCLVSPGSVERWMKELATEISERLEKDMEENNRRAKQIVLSFSQCVGDKNTTSSRTLPLNSYEQAKIAQDCLNILKKLCGKPDGTYSNVTYLGLSAGHFENIRKNCDIKNFFKNSEGKNKNKSLLEHEKSESCLDVTKNKIHIPEDNTTDFVETDNDDNFSLSKAVSEIEDKPQRESQKDFSPKTGISSPKDSPKGKPKTESFFRKYFESNPIDNSCSDDENRKSIEDKKTQPTTSHNSEFDSESKKKSDKTQKDLRKERKNGVKRKADQTKPILSFLQKYEDLNEENSEYCTECRKRIKLEDVEIHADYHTARQLHQEINSSQIKKHNESSKKSSGHLKNKNSKMKNDGNILKFFKMS